MIGVDDNDILNSPYGTWVDMRTESNQSAFDDRNTNLTLIISDNDEGRMEGKRKESRVGSFSSIYTPMLLLSCS